MELRLLPLAAIHKNYFGYNYILSHLFEVYYETRRYQMDKH